MWRGRLAGGVTTLWLAACTAGNLPVEPPVTAPAFDAALRAERPTGPEHACWHESQRPALFETVTVQVIVTPEQRDAQGAVIRPATFRSDTQQRELRPRQTVWYRIPCRSDVDAEASFTASLQRALKARGLYGGSVTGTMDDATETAVRRYQAANGLDSAVLSLAAAQALGLVSVAD